VIAGTVVATKPAGTVLDAFPFNDEFEEYAPAIMTPAVTSTIKPTINHVVVLLEPDEFAIALLYLHRKIKKTANRAKLRIKKPLHDGWCGGRY
jgi:hypothetical protein